MLRASYSRALVSTGGLSKGNSSISSRLLTMRCTGVTLRSCKRFPQSWLSLKTPFNSFSSNNAPSDAETQLSYRCRLRTFIHPFVLRHLDLSFREKGLSILNERVIQRLNKLATCPSHYLGMSPEMLDVGLGQSWKIAPTEMLKTALAAASSTSEVLHIISSFYLSLPCDIGAWQFLDEYCSDYINKINCGSAPKSWDVLLLCTHALIAGDRRLRTRGLNINLKSLDSIHMMLSSSIGKVDVKGESLTLVRELYVQPNLLKIEHFEKLSIALQLADRQLSKQNQTTAHTSHLGITESTSTPSNVNAAFARALLNTTMSQFVSRLGSGIQLEVGLLKHFWSLGHTLGNFTGYVYYKTIFDLVFNATKSKDVANTNSSSSNNNSVLENIHQLNQVHVLRSLFVCMAKQKVVHSSLVDTICYRIDKLPTPAFDSISGSIGILMFQRLSPLGISDRALAIVSKAVNRAIARSTSELDVHSHSSNSVDFTTSASTNDLCVTEADTEGVSGVTANVDEIDIKSHVNENRSGAETDAILVSDTEMELRNNRKLLQNFNFSSDAKNKIRDNLMNLDRAITPPDACLALLIFRNDLKNSSHYLAMQTLATHVAQNASLFSPSSLFDLVRTMAFCGYNNPTILRLLEPSLSAAVTSSKLNGDQRRFLLHSYSKLNYTPANATTLFLSAATLDTPSSSGRSQSHNYLRSATSFLWAVSASKPLTLSLELFKQILPIMETVREDIAAHISPSQPSTSSSGDTSRPISTQQHQRRRRFFGATADVVTLFQCMLEVRSALQRDHNVQWSLSEKEEKSLQDIWDLLMDVSIMSNFYKSSSNSRTSSSWMHSNASFYLKQLGWRHKNEVILNPAYSADVFFDINDLGKFSDDSEPESKYLLREEFESLERKYKALINPNSHWECFIHDLDPRNNSDSSSSSSSSSIASPLGVVLEFDGPSHFGSYIPVPLGHTSLKRKQLEHLGYIVISIPFTMYNQTMSPAQRRKILVETVLIAKDYAIKGRSKFRLQI